MYSDVGNRNTEVVTIDRMTHTLQEVCKRGMSTPELQEIYLTKKQELLEKETQRREEKANPGGDDKPVVIKIGPVLEEATNTNPEGLKRNPASAA